LTTFEQLYERKKVGDRNGEKNPEIVDNYDAKHLGIYAYNESDLEQNKIREFPSIRDAAKVMYDNVSKANSGWTKDQTSVCYDILCAILGAGVRGEKNKDGSDTRRTEAYGFCWDIKNPLNLTPTALKIWANLHPTEKTAAGIAAEKEEERLRQIAEAKAELDKQQREYEAVQKKKENKEARKDREKRQRKALEWRQNDAASHFKKATDFVERFFRDLAKERNVEIWELIPYGVIDMECGYCLWKSNDLGRKEQWENVMRNLLDTRGSYAQQRLYERLKNNSLLGGNNKSIFEAIYKPLIGYYWATFAVDVMEWAPQEILDDRRSKEYDDPADEISSLAKKYSFNRDGRLNRQYWKNGSLSESILFENILRGLYA